MFLEVNQKLFRLINELGKEYVSFNPAFVFIAEYMVAILAVCLLIYWFSGSRRNRLMVISCCVSFLVAEVLGKLSGSVYSNQQPFAELENVNKLIDKTVGNSFPSDHTILFFSITVSIWLFRRRYSFLWIVVALLVGISRIWVGVHYPADVLFGAFIASISAVFTYFMMKKATFMERILNFYEKKERTLLQRKSNSKNL